MRGGRLSSPVGRMIGILLMMFSMSMLTPIPVAMIYHNQQVHIFLWSFVITFVCGGVLWWLCRGFSRELRARDAFLVVFFVWFVLCLFGALPFILSPQIVVTLGNAFFETVSGLTTTGATVLRHLDHLPESMLFYRQQLEFLGGMGIIVLAVAIMPMVGIGGTKLYRAEASIGLKDQKVAPRITQAAKSLWLIYVGLTVICCLCYWGLGMHFFDAICYAFSTVSTGGFAPHDASMAYYSQLGAIQWVCIVFMIAGSTNFALHYVAIARGTIRHYWHNSEFKRYCYLLLTLIVITLVILIFDRSRYLGGKHLLSIVSQVVSFSSTTGFVFDAHYTHWPSFLPLLLVLSGVVGASSGSTAGGIKVIRAMLLKKQITREIKTLIHPSGVFPVRVGRQLVSERAISTVWGFISAYLLIFIVFWLALIATGLGMHDAFAAVAACLSNVGPGLGQLSVDYTHLPVMARWILIAAMLMGRLEVFTVLVLLSPSFWRQ